MRRMTALVTVLLLGVAACREAPEPPDTTAEPSAPVASTTMENGMLDPERATREDLVALPGMTEQLADQIIAARPIENMLEVDQILAGSLSEQQRDTVYTRLWKPLDLNTASGDEILLVPGVGPRMRHEFEEYRPYVDIAQFRREMGKYVDAAEVDRLAKYVTIR